MTTTDTIPDLWPSAALKMNVLTPVAILRTQATRLGQRTGGVLVGEVTVVTGENKQVVLSLELIVPALNNYRYRLLSVRHAQDAIYPAEVSAKSLKSSVTLPVPKSVAMFPDSFPSYTPNTIITDAETAYSEKEFISIVQKALRAPETIAFMQSLIVRSNEETSTPDLQEADAECVKGFETKKRKYFYVASEPSWLLKRPPVR